MAKLLEGEAKVKEEEMEHVEPEAEDNDGPPPAKKGGGRPKKFCIEEDETPDVSEDGEDNDGPPPAKKGRGRPKKALLEKEDETPDVSEDGEEDETPDVSEDGEEDETPDVSEDGEDNDGPPPAKKGRGRPKKALLEKEDETPDVSEDGEEDETPDVSEDGEDNDGPPPAKKGRGRPKKALLEKAHRQESAAKKGRGRPKKSEKVDLVAGKRDGVVSWSDVDITDSEDGSSSEESVYSGREEEEDSSSEESVYSSLEEEEDSSDNDGPPPAKKGRGQPKKALSEKAHRRESAAKKGRGRPKKSEKKYLKCTKCNRVNRVKARFCDWCGTKKLDDRSGGSKKPKYKKRAEVTRERSFQEESSEDESSDSEAESYDSEADYGPKTHSEQLLIRNWTGETKEAGSLRERTGRQSYKDDSDADLESGFESSDMIAPHKQGLKRWGRPRKAAAKTAAPVGKKGVRRVGRNTKTKDSFKEKMLQRRTTTLDIRKKVKTRRN